MCFPESWMYLLTSEGVVKVSAGNLNYEPLQAMLALKVVLLLCSSPASWTPRLPLK